MKNSETKGVVYVPAIRTFEDTGSICHGFDDGTTITGKVVRSGDSDGFAINLRIKKDDRTIADFTMDRFGAICMVDTLVKNLMNQEELVDATLHELYKFNNLEDNNGRADSAS